MNARKEMAFALLFGAVVLAAAAKLIHVWVNS